ncbi:sodium-dependent transporter [Listeria cornellensis]|uniref:Sodium:neurotransmitter symporter n=1 Tax=Listeria cornellensis FSL F6-0969 TaxID=1265820 RepID=W7C5K1_9LIST|nr:sodium-dependent transporter [Listeria cornellensis]EUJ32332.1 sodium:neurotransmitter symporter [Listeria cornellensis FSL F6-0969]
MQKNREQWTSKLGFILASAGSAIGLGALWKMPYVTANAGGGAFFLIFAIFTLFIGLPVLLGEFVIGRNTQSGTIAAYRKLAPNTKWDWTGRIGVLTCFLILAFYCVVGGWAILYIWKAATGALHGLSVDALTELFVTTSNDPLQVILATVLFIAINFFVLLKGITAGIERANRWMMPALFLFLLILIVYALTLPNAMDGVAYFLQPKFEDLSSDGILQALGQSFFSLAVGVGGMITYASYLKRDVFLPSSALTIALMNLLVSLFAGLAIFPAAFSFGIEPQAGPGLLFIVLPAIFNQVPFGIVFLLLFLVLFLFAALTSSFNLFEVPVTAFLEKRPEARKRVLLIVVVIVTLLAVPTSLSTGVLADVTLFGKNLFGIADYLASNILLPIGAFLIAIFVGFRMPRQVLLDEITSGGAFRFKLFAAWLLILKYVCPIAIFLVFLQQLGIL